MHPRASAHTRSAIVALAAVGFAAFAAACNHAKASTDAPSRTASTMNVYSIPVNTLEGKATNLDSYAGKVTLVVNVASYCGNTPQYTALEALNQRYQAKGFAVLGFPSNDFGQQEPGTAQEIREFCSSKYHVTFPLFEKVKTKKGEGQAPLYAQLGEAAGQLPTWNFAKYLVGRDGHVLQYFDPKTKPDDPKLVAAIDSALAAPAK
jgi:glutathione peroxidase